jgi:hypothetical protein
LGLLGSRFAFAGIVPASDASPVIFSPELSGPGVAHSSDEARRVRVWRRHRYIVASFLVSMLVCGWFVTWGGWRLFEREQFCGFYDAQALSILNGHLDVPRAAIGCEAFTFEGKTYGYFGITPALLRIPLLIVFDEMDGLWSRLMMLIACGINLLCAYKILRLLRRARPIDTRTTRALHSLFILCAGIGSTNIFLVGRSFTYHEAIIWAGAFALLFTWTVLNYFARPRGRLLALAALFAFMSFHSRPTVGAGVLLGLGAITAILIWRRLINRDAARSSLGFEATKNPMSHALIGLIAIFLTVGVYFGINYAKFHTFNGVPLQYYDFYKLIPIRMQLTGGRQIHFENIPTTVATYLGGSGGFAINTQFPWIFLTTRPVIIGSPAIDIVEGYSSYPASMPALCLLAVAGVVALVRGTDRTTRSLRLPALAVLIGGGIMLTTVGITERYLHDFYPALILLGAVGVARIEAAPNAVRNTAVIAVLTGISIYLNCAFSLVHQRTTTGSSPAKQAEFAHLQRSISSLFRH